MPTTEMLISAAIFDVVVTLWFIYLYLCDSISPEGLWIVIVGGTFVAFPIIGILGSSIILQLF